MTNTKEISVLYSYTLNFKQRNIIAKTKMNFAKNSA